MQDRDGFKNLYLDASRINHSCDPNCQLATSAFHSGQVTAIALRDIEIGEQITFDYHQSTFLFF